MRSCKRDLKVWSIPEDFGRAAGRACCVHQSMSTWECQNATPRGACDFAHGCEGRMLQICDKRRSMPWAMPIPTCNHVWLISMSGRATPVSGSDMLPAHIVSTSGTNEPRWEHVWHRGGEGPGGIVFGCSFMACQSVNGAEGGCMSLGVVLPHAPARGFVLSTLFACRLGWPCRVMCSIAMHYCCHAQARHGGCSHCAPRDGACC